MKLNRELAAIGVLGLGMAAPAAPWQIGDERFTLRPAHDGIYNVYGSSVDIDGSMCVIGSPPADGVDACGYVYLFDFVGTESEVPLRRFSVDCVLADKLTFGSSVGISPLAVAVGAPSRIGLSGKAYVFNPDTGDLLHELEAPEPLPNQRFGIDVDVSNTIVVVGAPGTAALDDPEAAYLYSTTDGTLIATLVPGDGAVEIDFGYSVAIHGNVVAVGAPQDDELEGRSGAVYLFDITDPTSPVQTAKLLLPVAQSNAAFGFSVDTDGVYVIAGADEYDTASGSNAGAAFIFNAGTGAYIATLEGSEAEAGDRLGVSVGISGGYAVLGYTGHYASTDRVGGAYVFDISIPASPVERSLLVPDEAQPGDGVGYAVGVGGGVAVVGAVADDDNGTDRGTAFRFDPTTGEQLMQLWPLGGTQYFGSAIAQTASVQVIGAPSHEGIGSVRFYCPVTGKHFAVLHSPSRESGGQFGYSVAVVGQVAAIAADAEGGSIYLVDISDPRSPVITGQLSHLGLGEEIGMTATHVFRTTNSTLSSFRIAGGGLFLADSIELGDDHPYFGVMDISADGDLAVIGSADRLANNVNRRVVTVDISDPSSLAVGFDLERVGSIEPDKFTMYGTTVAVYEHLIAVGSSNETPVGGAESQGMVWLFNPLSGVCLGSLIEPGGAGYGGFGNSIDIYKDTLVISANPSPSVPDSPHEVHMYNVYGFGTRLVPVYQGYIDSTEYPPPGTIPPAYDSFGSSLNLSSTGLMVGASSRYLVRNGELLETFNGTVTAFGYWRNLIRGNFVAWPEHAGFSPGVLNTPAALGLPDLSAAVLAGPEASLLLYGFEPLSPYAPGQLAGAFGVPPGALQPYDAIVIGRSQQPGSTFETCAITVSDGLASEVFEVVYGPNGATQGPGWVSVPSTGFVANAALGSQIPDGMSISLLLLDLGGVNPFAGNLSASIQRTSAGQSGSPDSPEVLGFGVLGVSPRPCSVGDVAAPFNQLNFFDVAAFVTMFASGDPSADLADPIGQLNFFDLALYLDIYKSGCP